MSRDILSQASTVPSPNWLVGGLRHTKPFEFTFKSRQVMMHWKERCCNEMTACDVNIEASGVHRLSVRPTIPPGPSVNVHRLDRSAHAPTDIWVRQTVRLKIEDSGRDRYWAYQKVVK